MYKSLIFKLLFTQNLDSEISNYLIMRKMDLINKNAIGIVTEGTLCDVELPLFLNHNQAMHAASEILIYESIYFILIVSDTFKIDENCQKMEKKSF